MATCFINKMILGSGADVFFPLLEAQEPGVDFDGWCEELGMVTTSPSCDADYEQMDFGFEIEPVTAKDMTEEWLHKLQALATKFTEITGLEATLFSVQDAN